MDGQVNVSYAAFPGEAAEEPGRLDSLSSSAKESFDFSRYASLLLLPKPEVLDFVIG
jgi:hypothetical protein